ncbi:MAG: 1-(5-phosphoribosyl)-5-[(5-phosphoribosylamino)methylideneamino]imidazole-4-carboxamide isomerase [Chloroflexi bacterium]|nr:1-(5-phosphoribosyl)-5-[(5-phosphoribosylamino)methylideneamino]imidazole-4-carboxamide isomerase [Chloroflexota bacterium]
MIIIPAIDLIDGEVVRLHKGNYSEKKIYNVNPINLCNSWKDLGIKRIHIVDLQGALNGNQKNLETIKKIKSKTNLEIQIGGGIRSFETSKKMIDFGISKVIFGTAAVDSPEEIDKAINYLGKDKVIVGIDLLKGKIKISGWTKDTKITYQNLITDMKKIGVEEFMFTDVEKDGTLTEPNYNMFTELIKLTGNKVVAAGGISSEEHLIKLNKIGVYGSVVGKALYEGKINISKLKI